MTADSIEVINLNPDETAGLPVVINNESGSIVTVNFNTKNTYNYSYPDWLNADTFKRLLEILGGRKQ